MASKADFTPEEWKTIVAAAPDGWTRRLPVRVRMDPGA